MQEKYQEEQIHVMVTLEARWPVMLMGIGRWLELSGNDFRIIFSICHEMIETIDYNITSICYEP